MRRHYIEGFLDALELVQRELDSCETIDDVQEIITKLILLAKERRLDEISRELGYFRISTR